jgi:carboxymethylenebutenolidase
LPSQDVPLGRLHLPGEPGRGETWPGVVFIHDVWGLTEHSQQFCERLSSDRFAVLELEFYRRTPEPKITDPGHWIRELDDSQVLGDAGEGVRFLSTHPACAERRIGVTGVCMGGMYALLAAASVPGLSAAAPFYGLLSHGHGLLSGELDPARKPRSPLDAAADVACPLLGFFGEDDDFVPLEDVRELERRLDGTAQETEVVIYPGAGHAFMNEPRVEAFRPEAAADAWSRLEGFLHRHLD